MKEGIIRIFRKFAPPPDDATGEGRSIRVTLFLEWRRARRLLTQGPMSIENDFQEFVRTHEMWAAPIVGALAFAESLAFISLLVPAFTILIALGVVAAKYGISFWPILVAGAVGAALGDWLSYWIGIKVGPAVGHMWPLSRHPDLIPRGERFVTQWGALGIFIGRFFGPLRAAVPLVAGIFQMPWWRFQISNFVSAFVWVAVLLTAGDAVGKLVGLIWP
jgi:membrane protein DedA with SNARE-associated domain